MSEGDRNDTLLSLLAGIGIGALVGAATALLLAPQTGQETRSQIRETADDLLVRLRDTVEDLRVRVDELVTNVKSRAAGGADRTGSTSLAGEGAEETPAAGV